MSSIKLKSLAKQIKAHFIRLWSGTRMKISGKGHRVNIDEARLFGATIEISGSDNELTIGPNTRLWGAYIVISGQNVRCSIGDHCRLRGVRLIVEDNSSQLIIHRETSGTGCTLLAGEGGVVEVGEDCMMSVGADIRNTDGHSVIDVESGWRINPAADVHIGDHAWIGLGVQVLKGIRFGSHSIAAAGCVVVKDVPPNTIVAGIPARPIRSGITWARERLPTAAAYSATSDLPERGVVSSVSTML